MSTSYPDLWAALTAPFPRDEIRQRDSDKTGKKVSYITAQSIKTRLDDVLGPENWWVDYLPLATGVECKLTLRMPDGSTVHRVDAGGGRDVKAAYSDGIKRAGEGFGIGRHLKLGARLPSYGRPASAQPDAPLSPGQELVAWARAEGQKSSKNILEYLNKWGAKLNYPSRIHEWNRVQADAGRAEVERQLARAAEMAHTNGRYS